MKLTIEISDYSKETQMAIASETTDAELLDSLVKNSDVMIANVAIDNLILRTETLEFIVKSYVLKGNIELAKKAILHQKITPELIDEIVRKICDFEVDVYAASRLTTKSETLVFLSERYSDSMLNKVHELLVMNQKSNKKCLEYILNNAKLILDRYADMHKIARSHPNYKSE